MTAYYLGGLNGLLATAWQFLSLKVIVQLKTLRNTGITVSSEKPLTKGIGQTVCIVFYNAPDMYCREFVIVFVI